MRYQMVDPRNYVVLPRWQLGLVLFSAFAVGLLVGGVVVFKTYRAPALEQIATCQKKLDEATHFTRKAQSMACAALQDNISVLSQAEFVAKETMFHSEQLFRRRNLSRESRTIWADALEEAKATGVGGPEPGDEEFTQ